MHRIRSIQVRTTNRPTDDLWPQVVRRAIEALKVRPGGLIQVRERTERVEGWQELDFAIPASDFAVDGRVVVQRGKLVSVQAANL